MDTIIQQKKAYSFLDFLRISFRISPVSSAFKLGNEILGAIVPSLQVLVTAQFIDTALAIFGGTKSQADLLTPLLLLMLFVAYSGLNRQLISYANLKYEMQLTKVYRSAMAEKRAKLEYRHIENNETWDLLTRTCTDPVKKISAGFTSITDSVNIILRVFSLLFVLMAQVWWAGIAIVAISAPLFYLAAQGGKATYEANVEAQKYTRRATYLQTVLQSRENVEERALFGYTDAVNKNWHDKFESSRKINQKVSLKYFIRMKSSSVLTAILSLIIMAVLLFPLSTAAITIGMFLGLVSATINLIQMMSWQLTNAMKSLAESKEYLKDLGTFSTLSETEGALDLPCQPEEITFETIDFIDVSFRYPETDAYILRHFNLHLEKNLHYAFVGINGAGKTTITKLLTGLYDNFEGEILINNKTIREYSQAQLKALFSVVYQDFAKYSITMRENIALGNVLEDDEEGIQNAASLIGLDEAIANLPQGMDTPLGKIKTDGSDLSGGQWQRVAIARALYNPAEICILDEPTAALDPIAESNIYKMFARISKGKSTIFITHRLGAARLADEIIVVDQGRVAEQGSHDHLLSQDGIYREMFDAQRSWYQ